MTFYGEHREDELVKDFLPEYGTLFEIKAKSSIHSVCRHYINECKWQGTFIIRSIKAFEELKYLYLNRDVQIYKQRPFKLLKIVSLEPAGYSLLSIDTHGEDELIWEALSNSPKAVVIRSINESQVMKLGEKKGYALIARRGTSYIWRKV